MNKWVKVGLGVGAGVLVTTQAVKYAKKHDLATKIMDNLKRFEEFSELKEILIDVVEAFTNNDEGYKQNISGAADYEKDESIADAVKSVFDTKLVQDLIPEQSDIDLIKEVIDEAAKVEQLVRGWLK